jgi:hypothetical protein
VSNYKKKLKFIIHKSCNTDINYIKYLYITVIMFLQFDEIFYENCCQNHVIKKINSEQDLSPRNPKNKRKKSPCETCGVKYNLYSKHCCYCKINYNVNKKHCCICQRTIDNNVIHCENCHVVYELNQYHCCKCNYVSGGNMRHCDNCHKIMDYYKLSNHVCKSVN